MIVFGKMACFVLHCTDCSEMLMLQFPASVDALEQSRPCPLPTGRGTANRYLVVDGIGQAGAAVPCEACLRCLSTAHIVVRTGSPPTRLTKTVRDTRGTSVRSSALILD